MEAVKLSSLTGLDLWNNSLTGTIPSQFGSPDLAMQEITLTHNQLQGTVPPELFGSHYETIKLGHNSLTCPIPTEVGNFQGSDLRLNDNLLTGTLPEEVTQATNLHNLFLEHNKGVSAGWMHMDCSRTTEACGSNVLLPFTSALDHWTIAIQYF